MLFYDLEYRCNFPFQVQEEMIKNNTQSTLFADKYFVYTVAVYTASNSNGGRNLVVTKPSSEAISTLFQDTFSTFIPKLTPSKKSFSWGYGKLMF